MKHLFGAALASVLLLACAAETGSPPTPTGVGSELSPSEAYHRGTDLVWLRCPLGMAWDGADCAGAPLDLAFDDAVLGCSDVDPAYRLPALSELALLLGDCSGSAEEARCRPCAESRDCSETLSSEELSEWTWTADQTSGSAFIVEVSLGRIAFEDVVAGAVQARCVRSLR